MILIDIAIVVYLAIMSYMVILMHRANKRFYALLDEFEEELNDGNR